MAHPATHDDFTHIAHQNDEREISRGEFQKVVRHAYRALHVGFVVVPIVAGLDKFFHYIVDWNQYLAPQITEALGGNPAGFMAVVGVIEVVAGVGVLIKPKIFAYVVSLWLLGIVMNLFMAGQFYDIALRDFGLSLAAFALGRLSEADL